MPVTIDLPLELESELLAEAQRLNLTLPEYILRILINRPRITRPKTGAEVVAYWRREGLIGTYPPSERIEESDLVALASDLDIQRELRQIRQDFGETDL